MKKQWYFMHIEGEKSTLAYLNKLAKEGVACENIKNTAVRTFGISAEIYYYHTKEISQ